MVTRCDADHEGESADGFDSVVIREDGDFVTYKDYAELEAENARLRQQRDAANAQLDFVLENLKEEKAPHGALILCAFNNQPFASIRITNCKNSTL